jgi:hypothetical protein
MDLMPATLGDFQKGHFFFFFAIFYDYLKGEINILMGLTYGHHETDIAFEVLGN